MPKGMHACTTPSIKAAALQMQCISRYFELTKYFMMDATFHSVTQLMYNTILVRLYASK